MPEQTPAHITSTSPGFGEGARVGWEAALLEIEHQADHWDTADHGETGHLIAQALRAAVDILRSGGLHCEHRGGQARVPDSILQLVRPVELAAPDAWLPVGARSTPWAA